MTLPEMAIRFVLSNPAVSTTIVGMRRPEHVEANVSYSDKGPLGLSSRRTASSSLGPRACALVGLDFTRSYRP